MDLREFEALVASAGKELGFPVWVLCDSESEWGIEGERMDRESGDLAFIVRRLRELSNQL